MHEKRAKILSKKSFLLCLKIVNVNGVSLRGLGMEEARNVLKSANKSKSVDLTVARDESEEAVSYKEEVYDMYFTLGSFPLET